MKPQSPLDSVSSDADSLENLSLEDLLARINANLAKSAKCCAIAAAALAKLAPVAAVPPTTTAVTASIRPAATSSPTNNNTPLAPTSNPTPPTMCSTQCLSSEVVAMSTPTSDLPLVLPTRPWLEPVPLRPPDPNTNTSFVGMHGKDLEPGSAAPAEAVDDKVAIPAEQVHADTTQVPFLVEPSTALLFCVNHLSSPASFLVHPGSPKNPVPVSDCDSRCFDDNGRLFPTNSFSPWKNAVYISRCVPDNNVSSRRPERYTNIRLIEFGVTDMGRLWDLIVFAIDESVEINLSHDALHCPVTWEIPWDPGVIAARRGCDRLKNSIAVALHSIIEWFLPHKVSEWVYSRPPWLPFKCSKRHAFSRGNNWSMHLVMAKLLTWRHIEFTLKAVGVCANQFQSLAAFLVSPWDPGASILRTVVSDSEYFPWHLAWLPKLGYSNGGKQTGRIVVWSCNPVTVMHKLALFDLGSVQLELSSAYLIEFMAIAGLCLWDFECCSPQSDIASVGNSEQGVSLLVRLYRSSCRHGTEGGNKHETTAKIISMQGFHPGRYNITELSQYEGPSIAIMQFLQVTDSERSWDNLRNHMSDACHGTTEIFSPYTISELVCFQLCTIMLPADRAIDGSVNFPWIIAWVLRESCSSMVADKFGPSKFSHGAPVIAYFDFGVQSYYLIIVTTSAMGANSVSADLLVQCYCSSSQLVESLKHAHLYIQYNADNVQQSGELLNYFICYTAHQAWHSHILLVYTSLDRMSNELAFPWLISATSVSQPVICVVYPCFAPYTAEPAPSHVTSTLISLSDCLLLVIAFSGAQPYYAALTWLSTAEAHIFHSDILRDITTEDIHMHLWLRFSGNSLIGSICLGFYYFQHYVQLAQVLYLVQAYQFCNMAEKTWDPGGIYKTSFASSVGIGLKLLNYDTDFGDHLPYAQGLYSGIGKSSPICALLRNGLGASRF